MKRATLAIDCRMIKYSGIGTYIKNVIPGLIKANIFEIICLVNANIDDFDWASKVKTIKLKSKPFSLLEQIELSYRIPKCDIAWFPNWNITFLPIRAKYIVVTIHDVLYMALRNSYPRIKYMFTNLFFKMLAERADKIITVSNYSKNEILRYVHIEENKVVPIHLAISEEYLNEINNYERFFDPYILFVGNVKPHKNLQNAIKAFIKADHKEYKFYIVGKKEGFITDDKDLKKLADHKDIVFMGEVSDKDLKNFYLNAKLFFFPSKYEGFGLPILEAMKFNIPIIASNIGAIREVAGESIYYFDPYDVKDMTYSLNEFFKGMLKYDKESYKNCLAKYSWASTVEKHINLFLNEDFAVR